jgi:ABC-type amino acid transport substrate-binding protein
MKMKHRPYAGRLLIATLLTLASSNLVAQETEGTLEKIARTGEFVIGYRADSSPLSYENAEGQPSGYSVDLCRRVAAGIKAHFGEQEIETKFLRIAPDERISAVVDGKIDIECGSTTITLSRQEQVDFSLPTFVTGGSVLSLASSGIQSMADLSGKKVGVAKDTTTLDQLRNHLEQNLIDAEVVVVAKQLNRGDIDALASDQIVLIGQIIEAINPKRYALVSEIFSYEPYGFAVRRNDADFRLVVNTALSQLYRSGQHAAIFQKWIGRIGQHAAIFQKWIGRIGIQVPPILAAMYQLNALPE